MGFNTESESMSKTEKLLVGLSIADQNNLMCDIGKMHQNVEKCVIYLCLCNSMPWVSHAAR